MPSPLTVLAEEQCRNQARSTCGNRACPTGLPEQWAKPEKTGLLSAYDPRGLLPVARLAGDPAGPGYFWGRVQPVYRLNYDRKAQESYAERYKHAGEDLMRGHARHAPKQNSSSDPDHAAYADNDMHIEMLPPTPLVQVSESRPAVSTGPTFPHRANGERFLPQHDASHLSRSKLWIFCLCVLTAARH